MLPLSGIVADIATMGRRLLLWVPRLA